MRSSHCLFRALLWLICAYHLAVAAIAFMPSETVRVCATALLGLTLPAEPALYQVIKSFGVYAGAFGLMMGVAAWNPVKNRAMISVGVVLFALRIGQRLMNIEELERSFGVSPARNLGTVAVVGVIGLGLAWYRVLLWREMRGERKHAENKNC